MMMMMTIFPTNDVCDKEGKPADDEHPHHLEMILIMVIVGMVFLLIVASVYLMMVLYEIVTFVLLL